MRPIKSFCAVLFAATLASAQRIECATTEATTVSESFTLEVVATTMAQIVLQWRAEPAKTVSFDLERATDPEFTKGLKTYSLDRATVLFSDTDREPISKRRFTADQFGSILDRGTTYYYRVKAEIQDGDSKYSNTVNAKVSGPVRGREGDLWADVVLGKSGFGENTALGTTRYSVSHPGGILIDKTVTPNRMYIADCNNNRILGFKSTSTEDGAAIVLGQPDFSSSAGNGDSCAQLFPYRQPASASTLCLTSPTQISMGETVLRTNMTVDEKGNLYVPDIDNNRILKYNRPFETDTVADEVWGQADFSGDQPNRGNAVPGNNTISFIERAGVALDAEGNLWVSDSGNNRVLRFPKDAKTGIIAEEADLVLGQPDFSTNTPGGYGRDLSHLWCPVDVEFDSRGNLYVCDGISNNFAGRILFFEPPFRTGMAGQQMPMPQNDIDMPPERRQAVTVCNIVRDIRPNRLWFEKGTCTSELVDLGTGKTVSSIWCYQTSGIDLDSARNLYVVDRWSGIFRYPASSMSLPWDKRKELVQKVLVKTNPPSAGRTGGILGITTFRDQLIIAENSRLLIWNKFSVDKAQNGEPADDVWGEDDFSTLSFRNYIASPQCDESGRLWLIRRVGGTASESHHVLEAFEYPMTHSSTPVRTITLMNGSENTLSVIGGAKTHTTQSDFMDFVVVGTGDKIWVADRVASRVLRINNVDGREDPDSGPYVDIVLGQNNLTDNKLNWGQTQPGPRTLAWAYNVAISPKGELLITDNGGECGSNQRVLIYKAERFPEKTARCLFADDIGDPDRVIGTGGRLDLSGEKSSDPICSPFELGMSTKGTIVAGMNGYSAQRFPLVYLYPDKTTQPQMALGDFTAYPTTCFIDSDGNVYVGDFDWSRVLIYKKPFKSIRY